MGKNITRLVKGWGINDVDYPVTKESVVAGKRSHVWVCPYYTDWVGMLTRVFCEKYQKKRPTYKGCTIYPEWKYFSNFIKWVDSQPNKDWINCELDKDFLSKSNKHYGPDTVVYISSKLNAFTYHPSNTTEGLMIGVKFNPDKRVRPYQARCNNPHTGKREHLGYYNTELEAHKAWQTKKHEYACKLAEEQDDVRLIKALKERFAPEKDWTIRRGG